MKKHHLFLIAALVTISAKADLFYCPSTNRYYGGGVNKCPEPKLDITICQGPVETRFDNCLGIWNYSNGNRYIGEYKDGKRYGEGIFFYSNGTSILGDWVNNEVSGRFIEYSADNLIKRSGMVKEGKLVIAQYIDPNGFTKIEEARSAEAKRINDVAQAEEKRIKEVKDAKEAKEAEEIRIQEAKVLEERKIWLTTPAGKKFVAEEKAKAKQQEAERLRLIAVEAANVKKQEAERLRLIAVEAANVKKQEAERLRLIAVEAANVKKQEEQEAERLRIIAAEAIKFNNQQAERLRWLDAENRKDQEKQIAKEKAEKEQISRQCEKMNSWASDSRELIGRFLGVSVSSISLIRFEMGQMSCLAIVDTPKGPQKCKVERIRLDKKSGEYFADLAFLHQELADIVVRWHFDADAD